MNGCAGEGERDGSLVRVFAPSAGSRQGPLDGSVVLGIDPGLTRCGYAVLRAEGAVVTPLALGVIRTPAGDPLPHRLAELQHEVVSLIEQFRPGAVAVEQVFFQNNVRTAMSVGQASGIALAAGAAAGCDVVQFTPSQVKDSIAGWGGADKAQVQRMVQARLGLATAPRPADAADAAALALAYLASAPLRRRVAAATAVDPRADRTSA